VALRANEIGLFTMTPDKVRAPEVQAAIRGLNADVGVVVAYGKILPESLLNDLPFGWVNAHASLLPRWRGASPIQHAILAGDQVTGVTLMQLETGMDTGPTFASATTPIRPDATTGSLAVELSNISAQLFTKHLVSYLTGGSTVTPQPTVGVTTAPKIKANQGVVDWSEPASRIERTIRAFTPWPGVTVKYGDQSIKIIASSIAEGGLNPGLVATHQRGCSVGTGEGILVLEVIQPAGKKPMDVHAFLRGHPGLIGATLA
jgi:methionyl-tRNA formyltransferase